MLKTKAKEMMDLPEIRFPAIQEVVNRPAATLILAFVGLMSVYFTILGLRGEIGFLAAGDFVFRGFLPILIFPSLWGLLVWGYMVVYSDHKNIAKDRFTSHRRISLTDNRFGNWLIKKRWFQSLLTIPNFLFFLLVVVVGMFGYGGYLQAADSGPINGATFLTWNIWWVGMIFTFPLAGRLWCTMCPLGTVGEWAHRTHVPKHLTAMSLFLRYVSAAIFALTGGMIVGIALGVIFFQGPINAVIAAQGSELSTIEFILGKVPTVSFSTDQVGFISSALAYFTLAPGNFVSSLFTLAIEGGFPFGQLTAFLWATLTFFGVVISAVLGFLIKDYLYQAFIGTPLQQTKD
ncbi:MAG TPA: 4Fe-4S binding protein, partial [Candidatus Hodarchaeales archaeon]|nr:4Fe-4S binding protein [Candidatus Hodarchaeales archaeon]